MVKVNKNDQRKIQLEAGHWVQTVFNTLEIKQDWKYYNVDKSYYLKGIEQEINNILSISSNQLTLF